LNTIDITSEAFRVYQYAGGGQFRIEAPVRVNVIEDENGAQWFCGQHGQTNSVIGLRNRAYCLDCVIEVVKRAVYPAFRTTDFVPQ